MHIKIDMKTCSITQFKPRSNSASIVSLVYKRDCDLEEAQLEALLQTKDRQEAEDVLFAALEEMAARIEDIRFAMHDVESVEIPKSARRLAGIAGAVGFLSVVKAVNVFEDPVRLSDPVLMAAGFARLDRCFDAAVSQIWGMFAEV